MREGIHASARFVMRVEECDNIRSGERGLSQQVVHVVGLEAQLLDRIVRVDVSGRAQRDDVCELVKCLEEHRAVVLAVRILVVVELEQLLGDERLARERVLLVLREEGHDVHQVEDSAVGRADRVLEGREGERAAVEGHHLESRGMAILLAAPLHRPLARRQVHRRLRVLVLPHGGPRWEASTVVLELQAALHRNALDVR
mmetsp:Transcript_29381/g.67385  ORF Transcript_29381/g.67385 Transcript_29381/m.67385 type:complete len:200 (+) Transcript_29381:1726-2325(+)